MTSQKLKKRDRRGKGKTLRRCVIIGLHSISGGGVCPSVTLSTTNPTSTDIVVNLVIRDENQATDLYPICKTAQTHPVT
jgi:hypothetical protein